MPYLKIKSIVCEIAEEDDKDEIYLIHQEKKIWPKDKKFEKIDVDESLNIGLKVKIGLYSFRLRYILCFKPNMPLRKRLSG